MNKDKHLWSVVRLSLPFVGFCFICAGVYINSIQGSLYTLRVFFAYFLIALGLLSLLTGIFWSVCRGIKCKMYAELRRIQDTRIHVSTVDRPDFYPPSYEESQCTSDAHIETSHACEVQLGAAPPLYTQSSSDTVSVDFSHEEPPTYQQAVLQSPPEPLSVVSGEEKYDSMGVDKKTYVTDKK